MALVVEALFGYAWPPYFFGSVCWWSQAETLWRGHVLKPRIGVSVGWMRFSDETQQKAHGIFQRNTGFVGCGTFRGSLQVSLFSTPIFWEGWWIFLGWQQHCNHLKCPWVTVRFFAKRLRPWPSRWSTPQWNCKGCETNPMSAVIKTHQWHSIILVG